MPLFAEMSTEAILTICGTVALVVKFLEKVYDRWQLKIAAKAVADKVEDVRTDAVSAADVVAQKVAEVKGDVAKTAAAAEDSRDEIKAALEVSDAKKTAHLSQQDVVLEAIAKQTNGMAERLEEAAFAKGVKSEKDNPSDPAA